VLHTFKEANLSGETCDGGLIPPLNPVDYGIIIEQSVTVLTDLVAEFWHGN
jgi:hypothetical protein